MGSSRAVRRFQAARLRAPAATLPGRLSHVRACEWEAMLQGTVRGERRDARGARRALLRRASWLSRGVRESRRFVARKMLQRPMVARYHLRDMHAVVPIRHGRGGLAGSADAFVLHEVFRSRDYDPPEQVGAALAAAVPGPRVVDLGANLGFFSLLTLTRYP